VPLDSSGFIANPKLAALFEAKSSLVPGCRNRVLFREGDDPAGLYILRSGAATISTKFRGKNFAVTVQTTASSLLDLPALAFRKAHTFTAMAHAGAELSFVNIDDFIQVIDSNGLLYEWILKAIADEVESADEVILHESSNVAESNDPSKRSPSSFEQMMQPSEEGSSAMYGVWRRESRGCGGLAQRSG
jgi:CRP-like cAMP-binding protein